MKEIASINNEYIKYLAALKDKKNRNKEEKYLIEGYHLVEEAYKAGVLIQILMTDEINKYDDIEKIRVNEKIIEKLSTTKSPQKIIGVCKFKNKNIIIGDKLLLLDNINDPGNMGTIIRTSLGFDISTVLISEDCVDIYNEKSIRSSQGSIFHANIIKADLKKEIINLKEKGIKIIGTSLQSSIPLREIRNVDKYAILLGNEANGVKQELQEMTDLNIKIEINEKLESLNVAVAGAIVMYYLNK